MINYNGSGVVLVTGAAGFIGFHLSKSLLEKNIQVIGIDNINDYYDVSLKLKRIEILKSFSTFTFIKGDICVKEDVERHFKEYHPDIVINLAAQAGVRYSITNPDAYIQSNIVGFYNILECCRNFSVKHLIYASSSSVYGNNKKIPFAETDFVDKPTSLYAATKKSNELLAYSYSQLYNIPTTGLRFFTVYGPYGRPDMAYFSFTKAIYEEIPIKIFNNGELYRDFTYIDDIVTAIMKLIQHTPKGDEFGTRHKIYNIGNTKPVKLLEFINIIESSIGKKAIREYCPMQKADVYCTYADIEELKNDIGFSPLIDVETGISLFIDWYKYYYNK